MSLKEKNEKNSLRKPVQAGDYGKLLNRTDDKDDKFRDTNTDGRKTLSLWGAKGRVI